MSMSKKSIMKIRNNYNDYFYYKIPLNADSHKKHNYNLLVKYRRFWRKKIVQKHDGYDKNVQDHRFAEVCAMLSTRPFCKYKKYGHGMFLDPFLI